MKLSVNVYWLVQCDMYDMNQCDTAVFLKGRKTRRVFLSSISVSQVVNIDTMLKPTRGAHHHMLCYHGLARMCAHTCFPINLSEKKLIQASVLLHAEDKKRG